MIIIGATFHPSTLWLSSGVNRFFADICDLFVSVMPNPAESEYIVSLPNVGIELMTTMMTYKSLTNTCLYYFTILKDISGMFWEHLTPMLADFDILLSLWVHTTFDNFIFHFQDEVL